MINYITFIVLFCVFSTIPVKASNTQLIGTLVVVNKKDDTVNFIDLQSRKIKFTQDTGKGPHELAMSADGRLAIVTDYIGGNSLTVFDVQQAKKIKTIDLSQYPSPHGVLFLKDQRSVAVSSEGSDSVVIVDIISGQIKKVIDTQQKGSHMVAIPESSERVYTTNMDSNTVSELDVESGALLRKIATPNIPEAITVNKSGTELWVGSNEDGLVSVFNLINGGLIKQFKGFSFPYRVLLTRDEKFAVISDFKKNTLDIIDVKNKNKLKQVKFGLWTIPNGLVFHPNDRILFMTSYGKDKVVVIDIPTGKTLFELPTGDGPDGIGYSPLELQ
ncbi:YncE family protein [Pseudoalteromonas sp. C2R02]|uniref:YncE family protein n=1 Tax=Pseudoalteromonas sp. C2R02 TaxID=2841565 RepID=UPI001C089F43|nr:YncE family protein [Pseudoalteromonas sp. C2R02]MBU2970952.1 YncE family protein [Pseudoalteromonas sp. C2R02]